jgi:hypothetical protein
VILGVIALLALAASRSCGKARLDVSQAQAIEIAKGQIDYVPRCTFVRVTNRGLKTRATWAVSLSKPFDPAEEGGRWRVTVVQVDGRSGQIVQIDEGTASGIKC